MKGPGWSGSSVGAPNEKVPFTGGNETQMVLLEPQTMMMMMMMKHYSMMMTMMMCGFIRVFDVFNAYIQFNNSAWTVISEWLS